MRCEQCGIDLVGSRLCEACGVSAQPRRRFRWGDTLACAIVLGTIVTVAFAMDLGPLASTMRTRSLNNLKTLALAVLMYSQDYNETYPGWIDEGRKRHPVWVHNTWDEQIDPMVKSKETYIAGVGRGIRSYSQTDRRDRVLSYGLNGLLITHPKTRFDGNADFAGTIAKFGPAPLSPSALANPAGTILFAELNTELPMPGAYGRANGPQVAKGRVPSATRQWKGGLPGWIDISPRAYIEVSGPKGAYAEPYSPSATKTGIARNLYGDGGCFAFCDGHVQFVKIGGTVGMGQMLGGRSITSSSCWKSDNMNNMWIPQERGPTRVSSIGPERASERTSRQAGQYGRPMRRSKRGPGAFRPPVSPR